MSAYFSMAPELLLSEVLQVVDATPDEVDREPTEELIGGLSASTGISESRIRAMTIKGISARLSGSDPFADVPALISTDVQERRLPGDGPRWFSGPLIRRRCPIVTETPHPEMITWRVPLALTCIQHGVPLRRGRPMKSWGSSVLKGAQLPEFRLERALEAHDLHVQSALAGTVVLVGGEVAGSAWLSFLHRVVRELRSLMEWRAVSPDAARLIRLSGQGYVAMPWRRFEEMAPSSQTRVLLGAARAVDAIAHGRLAISGRNPLVELLNEGYPLGHPPVPLLRRCSEAEQSLEIWEGIGFVNRQCFDWLRRPESPDLAVDIANGSAGAPQSGVSTY